MTVTADQEAAELVGAVRDNPARRLELAGCLYESRPGRADVRSYRRAEMAFMSWQIRRGVLAAPAADRPGSPWWRAVNEDLLRDSWEGGLLARGRPGTPSRPSVHQWVRFFGTPSAEAWYRAHNASIVAGYLAHRDLAQDEHPLERFFMDVALVRMLYAHSLLCTPRLALGRFWPAGFSVTPDGAAPMRSCPSATSCRTGIPWMDRASRRCWTPRTTSASSWTTA